MKKAIPLLLTLIMMISFVGCGQAKTPDLSEVMKQIQTDIKFPEMAEQDVYKRQAGCRSRNGYYLGFGGGF